MKARKRHARRHQRGIMLLIAMVATVALGFAGVALVRAVSTNVAIGGNLDARRHATFAASAALEHDVVALFDSGVIDTTRDDAAHNYIASRQSGENTRGVPAILQTVADYPVAFATVDAGEGYSARHVIERLCAAPGDALPATCALSPPSVEAASGVPPPSEPPRRPAYRVTIRVDGPAGGATFVQAMLSGAFTNPRLSWRVVDE